jgi:hypothetical protein
MFLGRLGEIATATGTTLYAWALLPTHAHLLLRSGPAGLPQCMRRLLTGYAQAYNRRHPRVGPLVQHRYQSIVVEADASCRELVRDIHCHPLRAGLVPDLPHLGRYPWCGHAGILGRTSPPWQDRAAVLADERILGSGPFVERMLAGGDARQQTQQARVQRLRQAQALIRHRCRRGQVGLEELRMGSRRRRIAAVRTHLAVHLVTRLGLSLAETARQLGVSTSGIAKAVARAERPLVH